MGRRTTQRILECDVCGNTPNNGEPMWEMCGEFWCESCCDKDNELEQIPQFEGTKDALNRLSINKENNDG